MSSRKQESGQVFVLAALAMLVLIGVAAFATNAAYFFYQHQRMQAQVDEQTRLAAGSGCTSTWPNGTNLDGGTLVISPTNFFTQEGTYCDGVLTKSPGGLFGSILRFPNKIGVHAVAEHGGTTETPFSFLGLSNSTGQHNCSVLFAGSSTITVTGNVESNQIAGGSVNPTTGAFTGACDQDTGATPVITGGSYLYNPPPTYYDPYAVSVPVSGGSPTTASCGSYTCYTADITGVTVLPAITSGDVKLLPYNSTTPGVYLATHAFNPQHLVTTDSVVIVESPGNFAGSSGVLSGSGSWTIGSPDTGAFVGYSLYEETPCTPSTTFKAGGNFAFSYDGLIDLSCADITLTGGSGSTFKGAVVGYTITVIGGSDGTTVFHASSQPPRGAFLVQ